MLISRYLFIACQMDIMDNFFKQEFSINNLTGDNFLYV